MLDRRDLSGPFDIVGDIHGCAEELKELLSKLGYSGGRHEHGRRLVFLGDITDRGPFNLECLRIVRQAVERDGSLCVCGNHDVKLKRYLEGRAVKLGNGLAQTVAEIDPLPGDEKLAIRSFLSSLVSHYLLDQGRLVVAHAGLKEEYHGRASGRVRSFCLYGDTTGEVDEHGLPVRLDWALEYSGEATVVYGHTPVREAVWRNRTINIDTGCVFGGALTALRYPELELVSVKARRAYAERRRWGLSPRPVEGREGEAPPSGRGV